MTKLCALVVLAVLSFAPALWAQSQSMTISTVTREPFAMLVDDKPTGFSIELWELLGAELGLNTTFVWKDGFSEMLDAVKDGEVDGAVANISITAAREKDIDFTLPIFESGLQIMIPYEGKSSSPLAALFTWEIFSALALAIVMLFGGGMLMWVFERNSSDYFRRPAKEAVFPAFWWALNLVVNGGFEERMPQSRPGRGFAVLLVVASLFVVSVFVATITAAITVDALDNKIGSLSDLEGKRVGSIAGSTAATFLDNRDVSYVSIDGLEELYSSFEEGDLDAVIFDAPILAYYAATRGAKTAQMVERIFKPENYGIALPTGSPLREPLNQSLLQLRENGSYERLRVKWFGSK